MVSYGPSSCTRLFYKLFFSIFVKEIKITTGDDVLSNSWFCLVNWHLGKFGPCPGAHCTEIDFAWSFGAVIVKMIDLSKTESRDFFGIILGQENSQKLYLLPKSC